MGTNTSALRGPGASGTHAIDKCDAATESPQTPSRCDQTTQVSTDAVSPADSARRPDCAHERGHSAACVRTCLTRQSSLKILETLNNWRLELNSREKTASSLFSAAKPDRRSNASCKHYSSLQRDLNLRRCYSEGELSASENEEEDVGQGGAESKSLAESEPDVLAHIGTKLSSASIPTAGPPVPPVTLHLRDDEQPTAEVETQTGANRRRREDSSSVAVQATAMCMMATQTPVPTPRRVPVRPVNAARNSRLSPNALGPPRGRRPVVARGEAGGGRPKVSARGSQSNPAPNYAEIAHTATSIQSLKQALAKAK
ncbi:hypothetical protein AAHC03_020747 [Spirometra sp. Aus1]